MNISLAQKLHELKIHQAQVLAEILRDIDIDDPVLDDYKTRHIGSPAGSEKKLRGIPVVGAPGVGGTIAGTNPLSAVTSKERQQQPFEERYWPKNPSRLIAKQPREAA